MKKDDLESFDNLPPVELGDNWLELLEDDCEEYI